MKEDLAIQNIINALSNNTTKVDLPALVKQQERATFWRQHYEQTTEVKQ